MKGNTESLILFIHFIYVLPVFLIAPSFSHRSLKDASCIVHACLLRSFIYAESLMSTYTYFVIHCVRHVSFADGNLCSRFCSMLQATTVAISRPSSRSSSHQRSNFMNVA